MTGDPAPQELPTPRRELPELYDRMVESELLEIHPWALLLGDIQKRRAQHIEQVHPGWAIVPFARRTDCDDVACWTGDSVVIIDDYDPIRDDGVVRRHVMREFPSMDEWLLSAVRDFIDFGPL